MNKCKLFAVALIMSSAVLMSCGGTGSSLLSGLASNAISGTSSTSTSTATSSSSTGASVLGSLLSGTSSSSSSSSSLLSGVIGSLLNNTKSGSIIGTWTYSEPAVEFESSNLLAQAGGSIASNKVVEKLSPYYQKIGITEGKFTMTFNEDKTCTIDINGKSQTATYVYDSSAHTLKVTGQNLGLSFTTAYVTVSSTQMSLTFDSSKLLSLAKSVSSKSSNSTISTISTLASSFNGMKTGFKFNKSK